MFRKAKPESKCRRVPTQICKKKKCEKRRYIFMLHFRKIKHYIMQAVSSYSLYLFIQCSLFSSFFIDILRLSRQEGKGGGVPPIVSLRVCYTVFTVLITK